MCFKRKVEPQGKLRPTYGKNLLKFRRNPDEVTAKGRQEFGSNDHAWFPFLLLSKKQRTTFENEGKGGTRHCWVHEGWRGWP